MKKFILPILFVLLFATTPVSVFAQFPANCWDIMQDNSCLRNVTQCNIECGSTSDQEKVKACLSACGKIYDACSDERTANYKACVNASRKASDTQEAKQLQPSAVPTSTPEDIPKNQSPEPTDQPKITSDEPFILKFLGINPFELWLRVLTWSKAPALLFWLPEMSATEILDLNYEDGMIRVEIDSSSIFPANPKMIALKDTSEAQIRTGGQSEYQNLQPNQDIPDGAYIRLNKPTRFDIGAGDDYIEVQPVGQTGWAEFQIQKSKENESVDIIEGIDSRVKVRLGTWIDAQSLPEITNKVETDAWKMPLPAGEKLIDVPGAENTKRYSWDDGSGAVIKSNDWEKIEFKDSTVKLKEGEMEVKVRNDNPTENKFTVDANGFFDLVVVQPHFFISYNPKTKKGVVVVYEGEVEIKTKDGKVVKVKPDGDEPGVVVVSQKLSVLKLATAGTVVVMLIIAIILFIKRKSLPMLGNTGRKK